MNARDSSEVSSPAFESSIESVTRALLRPIIEFGGIHYPPDSPNIDEAYLEWLCLRNPAGVAFAAVIRHGGRMVGLALLVPMDLSLDGRQRRAYFVVNVLTHPEYRNMRLFSRLIDVMKAFCASRGEWLMGHPNAAALPGWKRKEMTFRDPLVPMIGGLDFGLGCRTAHVSDEHALRDGWRAFTEPMVVGKNEVTICRTAEFMRWRFLLRPDRSYRIAISHDRKGKLAGFSVTRHFKPGLRLLVDHGVVAGGAKALSLDRPCIAMVPSGRDRDIGAEIRCLRIPARKQMPFFATTFDGESADFSRISLAASDF